MTIATERGTHAWVETADGIQLSVWEWGDKQGPELLLIHGVAQCHLAFSPQLASAMTREFRVVAFDMRGHGASGKPSGSAPYRDPSRWGDDIARVIAAKHLRRPVVVGWSMGGRSLRQYLIQHGDAALSGISLVASRVLERAEFASARQAVWQEGSAIPLGIHIEATASFLRACYHRQPEPDAFAFALAYNMLLPVEARVGIAAWVHDLAAATRALQAVTVPVLITHGLQDAVVPTAASQLVADTIPGARLSWYDDCGHSPFQEQPERFNQELAAFVREVWRG
jgi:non-heme chloroperoxidase